MSKTISREWISKNWHKPFITALPGIPIWFPVYVNILTKKSAGQQISLTENKLGQKTG